MNSITIMQQLRREIAGLLEPRSYFAGKTSPAFELPQNMLLFHRSRAEDLSAADQRHHRYVLIINCKSEGSVVIDHKAFRLKPGQAILVFPHQFHGYFGITQPNVEWLYFTFDMAQSGHLLPLRFNPVAISAFGWTLLKAILATYLGKYPAGTSNSRLALLSGLLLNELAAQSTKAKRIKRDAPVDDPEQNLMSRINEYVYAHLNSDLKIPQIARRFSISETFLRNTYRHASGIQLSRYIEQIRLHRASGMLLNSAMRIDEIAFECGYGSLSAFSRAFRRKMKASPREYRKTAKASTP